MLRIVLAILSVSTAVSVVLGQVNYCTAGLCGSSTHIACNNNGVGQFVSLEMPEYY